MKLIWKAIVGHQHSHQEESTGKMQSLGREDKYSCKLRHMPDTKFKKIPKDTRLLRIPALVENEERLKTGRESHNN